MTYRIAISEVAEIEVEAAYLWILRRSPDQAAVWYEGLLRAIESLSEFPRRCAYARENDRFEQEIRQLLYGRGRNVYRILFAIVDPSGDESPPVVRILHVRHAARPELGTETDGDGS